MFAPCSILEIEKKFFDERENVKNHPYTWMNFFKTAVPL